MIQLHTGRQTFDYDCGAKALQTVMAYYGVETRGDELMQMLGTDEDGTTVPNMIRVAEQHGFRVQAGDHWRLRDVKRFLDQGYPVIVLLQAWAEKHMTLEAWRNDYEDGHYAIVIDHALGVLLFEDPASFRRTWLRERDFLVRWHDRDRKIDKKYEQFAMVLLGKEPVGKAPAHMD